MKLPSSAASWFVLSRRLAGDRVFVAAWIVTFLTNVAWGLIFPLRNLYIRDAGVPLALVGTISTAGMLSFNLAGLAFGWLSDTTGRRRLLIAGSLLASVFIMAAYLWVGAYWHFLLLQILDLAMIGCYVTLVSARVTALFPTQEQGRGFGLYRMSGSFGFALASLSLGLVTTSFGIRSIFAFGAVAYFLAFGSSLLLRGDRPARRETSQAAPKVNILRIPGLIWFFAASMLAGTGQYMVFPFFPIYLRDVLSASDGQIGLVSTIGVLSEVPAMLYLGALSDRLGRRPILTLMFILETVRWFALYTTPVLGLVFVIQVLAGIGQARLTVSTVFMSDLVPYEQRATVLGLQQLVVGIGMVIAPTLGGLVAEAAGVRSIFAVAGLMGGAAIPLFNLTALVRSKHVGR